MQISGMKKGVRYIPNTSQRKLAHKDSNPDKQNQNLLCYRYTMGQDRSFSKSGAKVHRVWVLRKTYCHFFLKNFPITGAIAQKCVQRRSSLIF